MKNNNEQLLQKMIVEKDKQKLKYKQKLESIKQHYGVEFDIEYSDYYQIKNIKFIDLKYKNGYDNLSVTYDGITSKIKYIDYDYIDSRIVKNSNHKKFVFNLEKEFKLKIIVSEINKANTEYQNEINEIDKGYEALKGKN